MEVSRQCAPARWPKRPSLCMVPSGTSALQQADTRPLASIGARTCYFGDTASHTLHRISSLRGAYPACGTPPIQA